MSDVTPATDDALAETELIDLLAVEARCFAEGKAIAPSTRRLAVLQRAVDETERLSDELRHQSTGHMNYVAGLDTTVVSLRAALEASQAEVERLRVEATTAEAENARLREQNDVLNGHTSRCRYSAYACDKRREEIERLTGDAVTGRNTATALAQIAAIVSLPANAVVDRFGRIAEIVAAVVVGDTKGDET